MTIPGSKNSPCKRQHRTSKTSWKVVSRRCSCRPERTVFMIYPHWTHHSKAIYIHYSWAQQHQYHSFHSFNISGWRSGVTMKDYYQYFTRRGISTTHGNGTRTSYCCQCGAWHSGPVLQRGKCYLCRHFCCTNCTIWDNGVTTTVGEYLRGR